MDETEKSVPTIAVIDDDERVRITTSSLVRSLGYKAISFSSAEEFLQSTDRQLPACLISDVQMSGMSGLDLQDQLVAQRHRVPIIFITAFPHTNIEQRAREAGAICVLNKPFDSQVLAECLQRALKREGSD